MNTTRPKIAIDARLVAGQSTGDSTYWTSLVDQFRLFPAEFEFLLLSTNPAPTGWTDSANAKWIHAPAKNSRWWSLVTFPLAARKLNAAVIHTQYSFSPLVGNRGITTIHDVSFFIGPDWFPARHRLILQRTVPAAAKRAAAIITVSETSKSEIERFIPAARGKTVATLLACPDWIQPVDRPKASAFVQENFGLTDPFALTVSTRWPRKNMNLAVEAIRGTNLNLVLTGKAGWGDQAENPQVKSVGYVDIIALNHLYAAADMYLCPSLHEGFGIPVLEAFRMGCPVLASNQGAVPEVAGEAAILLDPTNVAAWTEAINSPPSKLAELRELGLQREKLFSWQQTAEKTLDVYRSVIEKSR